MRDADLTLEDSALRAALGIVVRLRRNGLSRRIAAGAHFEGLL